MHSRLSLAAASLTLPFALLAAVLLSGALLQPQPLQAAASSSHPATLLAHGSHTDTNTAAIVVQFDDARSAIRWVDFTAPISGLAALAQSGLDITVGETSWGPAVCAIEGVGCPADNCFCDANRYWGYSYWDGAGWQPYPVGAAESVISATGAIEGWRWGGSEDRTGVAAQAIAAASALEWLRGQQDPATGGFGNGVGGAVEVMMALGANDEAMSSWLPEGGKPQPGATSCARAPPVISRMARRRGGQAGRRHGRRCRLPHRAQPDSPAPTSAPPGRLCPDSGFNAWGILGAAALSESVPPGAVTPIGQQIQPDGGWEWQAGFGTDINTTALAVQALVAAGQPGHGDGDRERHWHSSRPARRRAAASSMTRPSRNRAPTPTLPPMPCRPFYAVGQDPASEAWTVDGATPITYLLSMQLPDGSFEWQPGHGREPAGDGASGAGAPGAQLPVGRRAVGELHQVKAVVAKQEASYCHSETDAAGSIDPGIETRDQSSF